MVASAAKEHHERIDGKGYPNGLRGEQLSLIARIVSITDAFDAMTSTRPYRKGMTIETVLSVLQKESGTQFDGVLVKHMCELGSSGDLAHIVGHTADGLPVITLPFHATHTTVRSFTVTLVVQNLRSIKSEILLKPK